MQKHHYIFLDEKFPIWTNNHDSSFQNMKGLKKLEWWKL